MPKKPMKESIVTVPDKKILSNGNSTMVDGVSINKGVVTGRKLKITSAPAIQTTTITDVLAATGINTPKDAIEVVANLTVIAGLIGNKIKQKKNDPDTGNIVSKGIEVENIKMKGKRESKHGGNKRKSKNS